MVSQIQRHLPCRRSALLYLQPRRDALTCVSERLGKHCSIATSELRACLSDTAAFDSKARHQIAHIQTSCCRHMSESIQSTKRLSYNLHESPRLEDDAPAPLRPYQVQCVDKLNELFRHLTKDSDSPIVTSSKKTRLRSS